jgi:hypothetical protein
MLPSRSASLKQANAFKLLVLLLVLLLKSRAHAASYRLEHLAAGQKGLV